MQTISGLLAGVCFAAALGGVIQLLSPGGSSERLLRLMVTLFVVAAACVPLYRTTQNVLTEKASVSTDAAVQAVLQNVEHAIEQTAKKTLEKYGCADAKIVVRAYTENGEVHAEQFAIYGVTETRAQEIAHELFSLTGEMPSLYPDAAQDNRE